MSDLAQTGDAGTDCGILSLTRYRTLFLLHAITVETFAIQNAAGKCLVLGRVGYQLSAGITMGDVTAEVLALNQKLLNAIVTGDWETYIQLCDPHITCFEPEARGQLVAGLPFHQFYFPAAPVPGIKKHVTMCSPRAHVVGDVAVLAYVRLTQSVDHHGAFQQTAAAEETRIWERKEGTWKHIHFHRSPLA